MDHTSRLSAWEDLVVGAYLLLIGILALSLNSLVIYTCLRHWRSLILSDYYILSLACSDILLPLSSFPLAIMSSLYHRWMFGDSGCVLFGFFGFFFSIVSIATVTVMGIMRYINICHPHIKITSRRCVVFTTIFPYFYALVWSCLPLKLFGSYSLEPYGTSCTLNGNGNRPFTVLMCMFCICIPLTVISIAYLQIVLRYKRSSRNVRKQISKNRKNIRKESFLMKITFIMFWSFLVSWMPYMIASLQSAYAKDDSYSIRFTVFATLMSRTSTVLNPVIYFLMSKKFRPLLVHSCKVSKPHFIPLRRLDTIYSWKIITELFNVNNEAGKEQSFSEKQKVQTRVVLTGTIDSVRI